jgi:Flp pilus assembly protein TadG
MPRLFRPIAALRRFARARGGATAIEFAIVAIPSLMLVFGVFELGMVLLVSTTLDTATDFASRNIRTGVFQTSGKITSGDFKALVCRNMTWLKSMDCQSRLTVEAQTFSTFADIDAANIPDPATFKSTDPRCWTAGNPGDIVLVRTYYSWPLFTPLLSDALANQGDGTSRLITSAKAFKNEPYNNSLTPVGTKC